jgi:hypothetical protein
VFDAAPGAVMEDTLAAIRKRHSSIRQYLIASGFSLDKQLEMRALLTRGCVQCTDEVRSLCGGLVASL